MLMQSRYNNAYFCGEIYQCNTNYNILIENLSKMSKLLLSVLLSVFLRLASCSLGFSTNNALTTANFQCFRGAGYSYAIVRGYRQSGTLDLNATQTLTNAKSAGLGTDIYIMPCPGKSASTQVDQLTSGIDSKLYNKIWILIDRNPSIGCYWTNHDATYNCQFLTDLISRFKSYGKSLGILSSMNIWTVIMGRYNCTQVSGDTSLWYYHLNSPSTFSDFQTFGGWTRPNMKSFALDTVCGISSVEKVWKA